MGPMISSQETGPGDGKGGGGGGAGCWNSYKKMTQVNHRIINSGVGICCRMVPVKYCHR